MPEEFIEISQIEIYKLSIPLKKPFVISLETINSALNIIVVIRTSKGFSGFGECSPFIRINGESQDTSFLVGQYLAKNLKGKNALDIESCSALMDSVIYGNSSIKSAFDIALHDIASQNMNMPLYKFLGGKKNEPIVTDYTISIGETKDMINDALNIIHEGFQVLKIKLGENADNDIARIKAIRKAIGKEIPIRIDANQGWSVEDAIKVLKSLKNQNIQYCEEPTARWDLLGLKKITKKSPIHVMADESCFDEHDARKLIHFKACDMFNIKLGKSSGLYKAKKIIRLAEKHDMNMQVGGFMESKITMTANAHLALSSKNILYADFDTPLMFATDPVSGGITYKSNGTLEVPETPGLGALIKKDFLDTLEKVII